MGVISNCGPTFYLLFCTILVLFVFLHLVTIIVLFIIRPNVELPFHDVSVHYPEGFSLWCIITPNSLSPHSLSMPFPFLYLIRELLVSLSHMHDWAILQIKEHLLFLWPSEHSSCILTQYVLPIFASYSSHTFIFASSASLEIFGCQRNQGVDQDALQKTVSLRMSKGRLW